MEENDNLWVHLLLLLITGIIIGLIVGLAIPKSPVGLQNSLGEAIVSSEYVDSIGTVGTHITYNNTIIEAVSSSIFIKSETLASIDIPDKWDIMADRIIQCESQNQMVWGDHDLPIKAYGVAQFQFRTFEWLKKLADFEKLDFYKESDQRWLLKWALQNGYGYLWTCSKLI